MYGISRRDLIRSAGVVVTLPLAANLGSQTASSQSASLGTSPALSQDLMDYLTDEGIRSVAKRLHTSSGLSRQDYLVLSGQKRLAAHHAESVGVDASVKAGAAKILAAGGLPSMDHPTLNTLMSHYLPRFQQVDSTITLSDLTSPFLHPPTADELQTGLTFVAQNGLSGCFHSAADEYKFLAYSTPVVSPASVHHPLYKLRGHLRLATYNSCQLKKYYACVAGVYLFAGLLVGGGIALCVTNPACVAWVTTTAGANGLATVAAATAGVGLLLTAINNLISQICTPLLQSETLDLWLGEAQTHALPS
jgi:hypothetical protein